MTIIFKILQRAKWKAMGSSPLSRLLKNVSFFEKFNKNTRAYYVRRMS